MSGLYIPNEGEIVSINEFFGATLENFTMKLFSGSHTPAETDTAATMDALECTFTGYSAKTLTRSQSGSTWSTCSSTSAPTNSWAPAGNTNVAEVTYGSSPQSWTNTGSSQNVNGYYYKGATSSKLRGVEQFASLVALGTSGVLQLTPRFGVAHS